MFLTTYDGLTFSNKKEPCSWLHMTVRHFPTNRNHAPDYIWRSDIFQQTETMLLTTYDRRTFSREQKPCSWLHMTVGHFPLTIMKDGLFHTSNPDCRKCQTSSFFGLEDMRHCRIFSRHEFRTFSCINFPKEGLGHLPAEINGAVANNPSQTFRFSENFMGLSWAKNFLSQNLNMRQVLTCPGTHLG